MLKHPKISVILPCLNEVSSMPKLIQSSRAIGWQSEFCELIIIDDGSVDGTRELLSSIALHDFGIKLIFTKTRLGLGGSILAGVLSSRAETIVVMDADGMHDPAYLPIMYTMSKGKNILVIGSRYATGGDSEGAIYPILSKFVNKVIQRLMNSKVQDQLCGFFISSRTELLKISDSKFIGFGEYFISVIRHFEKNQISILELPTIHRVRNSGKRKSKRMRMFISYIRYALANR